MFSLDVHPAGSHFYVQLEIDEEMSVKTESGDTRAQRSC
jgi:hypothetical protein